MAILLICLIGHAGLALLIPSPWLVPNLTLVGLVHAVGRAPQRWLVCSGLAGGFTVAWAIRFPGLLFAGVLALGWVVHELARRWDLSDARVQSLVVGSASLLASCGALWLDALWSLPLLGLACTHVAITGAAVPFVRGVAALRARWRGIT